MKPINIALAPNNQKDDVDLAGKLLFAPSKWVGEDVVHHLERDFAAMFGRDFQAFAVNSGRSAEFVILKALGIGPSDEVIIQAFTCVAVPNAIIWAGAKPVYADIDRTFNLDPEKLEGKISPSTKAIIVQHTFGIPAAIDRIANIAKKHKLILIEDCSHALGAKFAEKLLGSFGDVSFFSFGRDKVISSVFGGMIVTSNPQIAKKVALVLSSLPEPPWWWVAQQLFHPLAMRAILPLSHLAIGKFLLTVLQRLSLLSRSVYPEEKRGGRPRFFPSKMPAALAALAWHQLKKLATYNNHRQQMAGIYLQSLKPFSNGQILLPNLSVQGAIWLRLPLLVEDAASLLSFAQKKGVVLGDWYRAVVTPAANLTTVGYMEGSCPTAERLAKKVVNLPTNPNLDSRAAIKVVDVIKAFYGFNR